MTLKDTISQALRVLPKRMQDVLARRFGLAVAKSETLEAIGRRYGITRERVRQIEAHALALLERAEAKRSLAPYVAQARAYFERQGGLRRREPALEELGRAWHESRASKDRAAEASRAEFVLEASRAFLYQPETERTHALWALDTAATKRASDFIAALAALFRVERRLVPASELSDFLLKAKRTVFNKANPTPEALRSYLATSKLIAQNPFGLYGLIDWPEVRPRGVRDYAYLVFGEARRPLHFRELAREMNARLRLAHQAHEQTVHNELIKDPRFVLVGRGIYALKEWGYKAGTVREVLATILAASAKPLTRREILEKIKAQRLVKENTVVLNLQNRRHFVRLADGKYALKKGAAERA